MKLLTKEILTTIPKLYEQEKKHPKDVPVAVKYFNPYGAGTWYVTEYNPDEELMFGLCVIHEPELGYVSFRELSELRVGPCKLPIERDLHWKGSLLDAMREEGYDYVTE